MPVASLAALARGVGATPASAPAARRRSTPAASRSSPRSTAATGEEVWEPFVAAPDELAERVAALAARAAGRRGRLGTISGVELEAAGREVLADGDEGAPGLGAALCLLAAECGARPPEEIEPIYLRPPDAELWREQQRRDGSQAIAGRRRSRPCESARSSTATCPAVLSIERRAFGTPWSLAMFVLELSKPSGICLAASDERGLVGYLSAPATPTSGT